MSPAWSLLILLALAACSSGPAPLRAPPSNAPEWELNRDAQSTSNDLIQPPYGQRMDLTAERR